ncbi:uncharacterized protein LOC125774733 [Anopheles funestus]|uniref:uncharacterized protein LOC125774733 n=1 Tax=Anopheles funestus TaxID=62324 RepID=UPI0020C698A7|nr:uncharacterized protein LOC125774733 [Anopheles funestus]
MLFRFVVALMLLDVSFGQYEYPNYEEKASENIPDTYPNPDVATNPAPNPEPQYPDYSYVETVVTTTTTTTTTRAPRTKRPQVFPPTPTIRQTRRPVNRIVHWYILNGQLYPIRTAIRRRYRTGSQTNWVPPYYRNVMTGSRSTQSNAPEWGLTQRIGYWW